MDSYEQRKHLEKCISVVRHVMTTLFKNSHYNKNNLKQLRKLVLLRFTFAWIYILNILENFHSFQKRKMLKLLLYLTLFKIITADEVIRKHMLPLCVDSTQRTYKVEDPGRCSTEKNITQKIFPVNVYRSINTLLTLPAVACRRKIELQTCSHFFSVQHHVSWTK